MSTVATVLTAARALGQTDSNGLTDTIGLIFANEALLDYRRKLISAGVDAAQVQESYRDLTAGVGTYLWPTDMAWLKAIELNYGDQTAANYIQGTQVDVSNLPNLTSFGWLRQNASTLTPLFNDLGDWFEVFPTPTNGNSQGIRIFYFLEPTEYAATSDNIGYPESLDYRTLSYRIVASYYRSLNKFDEADKYDLEYEKKAKDFIATLSRGTQQPLEAQPISDSGWDY